MDIKELQEGYKILEDSLKELWNLFDAEKKKEELEFLLGETNEASFWNDKKNADKVLLKIKEIKNLLDPLEEAMVEVKNNFDLLELLKEENDLELQGTIENEYKKLKKIVSDLELELLLNGEYDKNNCIIEIHAGAGGTESQDWAEMLYRMYTRYSKRKQYELEELDILVGEEAGIKSVTFLVKGHNAYGYLKGERGIHRLVRISPFDSNKRRHTSFASVEVLPEINEEIDVVINPSEVRVDVFHSSGAGGQSVNTTDSAVRLTHIPTGIVVTCQNERSQLQNKEQAFKILKSKLYNLELEKKEQVINEQKQEQKSINFGFQKRNYVMCPYTLVKDQDTNYETSDVSRVLDGEIDEFIDASLRKR